MGHSIHMVYEMHHERQPSTHGNKEKAGHGIPIGLMGFRDWVHVTLHHQGAGASNLNLLQ